MRPAMIALVWLLPLVLVAAGPPAMAEPCTEPDDPCVQELLDNFTPEVIFEDDGDADMRIDWPIPFTLDGEVVEDNLELLWGDWLRDHYVVYRHATRITHAQGGPFWLLAYHYYYPADYDTACEGYKHEHDWEWIYVLTGWSESKQAYIGFVAVLSAHDASNIAAMDAGHTYVFPRIVLEYADWQRVLKYLSGERYLSNAIHGDSLTTASACATANGNSFSSNPWAGSWWNDWPLTEDHPASWIKGCGCGGETTTDFCYGDEMVKLGCAGAPKNECGKVKLAPWWREGLWDEASIPSDFWFPPPERLKTSDPGAPDALIGVEAEESAEGWLLRWGAPTGGRPAAYELVARKVTGGPGCILGSIPETGQQDIEAVLVYCPDGGDVYSGGHRWVVCSPCVTAQGLERSVVEIWGQWESGERKLLGRSAVLESDLESLVSPGIRVIPNPTAGHCAINFRSGRAEAVALEIVAADGRFVRCIHRSTDGSGWSLFEWEGRDARGTLVPGGVYWIRMLTGRSTVTERLVVIR